jgi:hypothetical protein
VNKKSVYVLVGFHPGQPNQPTDFLPLFGQSKRGIGSFKEQYIKLA